jgi:hypothetical protein
MKYNSFSLKIEDVEVSQYIKQSTFSLTLNANYDNTCDFTLTRSMQEEAFPLPLLGQDVEIKIEYDNNTIIRSLGIITRISKRKIEAGLGTDKKLEFAITCSSYNTIPKRRVVAEQRLYDEVKAGDIVKELLEKYLVQEGILPDTDYIEDGIDLMEYDIFANTKTVAEVLDDLASQSKYIWYIDTNKKLTFAHQPKEIVQYTEVIDESGTTNSIDILEAEVEETTDDYRNRQILVGGLGDDGYVVYSVAEDEEEIERMKTQTGGTGIWEAIETATDIDIQEKADARAEFLLNKYGKMKLDANITTLHPIIPGGLLSIYLPSIGINANRYYVDSVTVTDFAPEELLFELKVTHRKIYEDAEVPIIVDTEDEVVDYFEDKFKQIENLTNQRVTEILRQYDRTISAIKVTREKMIIYRRNGDEIHFKLDRDARNRIKKIINEQNDASLDITWN